LLRPDVLAISKENIVGRVNKPKSAKKPANKPANKPAAKPAAAPKQAKNSPALSTNRMDTQEIDSTKQSVTTFDKKGVKHSDESEIEIENNLDNLSTKAAMLKFLEEPVTIIIADSTEKDAEKMVFLSINGRGPGPGASPYVPRGVEVTIARKFVKQLARARSERVKSEEKVDVETAERYMSYPKVSSAKYPFQVVRDENPAGRKWLSELLRSR
jgi:hypothetical protein